MKKFLLSLAALLTAGAAVNATDVKLDFSSEGNPDFKSWKNSYTSHTCEFTEATVEFTLASKQTLADYPCCRTNTESASDVIIKMNPGMVMTAVTLDVQRYLSSGGTGDNATITYTGYSADGSTFTDIANGAAVSFSAGNPGPDGQVVVSDLPAETQAVKFTVTGAKNKRLYVCSATISYEGAGAGNPYQVYFDNTRTAWTTVYAYYWNGDQNNRWPGTPMTLGENNVWALDFNSTWEPANIIFNNSEGDQTATNVFENGKTYGNEPIVSKTFTLKYNNGKTAWDKVYVYVWDGGTNNTWPGQLMELTEGDIWSAELELDWTPVNVIFNNGLSDDEEQKTATLDFVDGKTYGEDQDPQPDTHTYTATFDNGKTAWEQVYIYLWNGGDNNTWPGQLMTAPTGESTVWSAEVALTWEPANVIFNNGKSGDEEQKTDTLDFTNGGAYGDPAEVTPDPEPDPTVTTYRLVTNPDEITVADEYILVNANVAGTAMAMGAHTAAKPTTNGYRKGVEVTVTEGLKVVLAEDTEVTPFVFEQSGDNMLVKFIGDGNYLSYGTSGTNLKEAAAANDACYLTVSINANESALVQFIASGRHLQWAENDFRAFAAANASNVYLFKRADDEPVTPNEKLGDIVINPVAGSYYSGQEVNISCTKADNLIIYMAATNAAENGDDNNSVAEPVMVEGSSYTFTLDHATADQYYILGVYAVIVPEGKTFEEAMDDEGCYKTFQPEEPLEYSLIAPVNVKYNIPDGSKIEYDTQLTMTAPQAQRIHYIVEAQETSEVLEEKTVEGTVAAYQLTKSCVVTAYGIYGTWEGEPVSVAYDVFVPAAFTNNFKAAEYNQEGLDAVDLINIDESTSHTGNTSEDSSLIGQNFYGKNVILTFYQAGGTYPTCFGNHVRIYAGDSFVITPNENCQIFSVTMHTVSGSSAPDEGEALIATVGAGAQTVGTVTGRGNGVGEVVWTKPANVEHFTDALTLTAQSNLRFSYLEIDAKSTLTGVETISLEQSDAPVEYFNLQGVRVANPQGGIFIVRQGNKISKVLVK